MNWSSRSSSECGPRRAIDRSRPGGARSSVGGYRVLMAAHVCRRAPACSRGREQRPGITRSRAASRPVFAPQRGAHWYAQSGAASPNRGTRRRSKPARRRRGPGSGRAHRGPAPRIAVRRTLARRNGVYRASGTRRGGTIAPVELGTGRHAPLIGPRTWPGARSRSHGMVTPEGRHIIRDAPRIVMHRRSLPYGPSRRGSPRRPGTRSATSRRSPARRP